MNCHLFLPFFAAILFSQYGFAAGIQLTLSHYGLNEHVTVIVGNNSLEEVKI